MKLQRMQRRWSNFTAADVQLIADRTTVEQYTSGGFAKADFKPDYTDVLAGKKLEIAFADGLHYTFDFKDAHQLFWSCDAAANQNEGSEATASAASSEAAANAAPNGPTVSAAPSEAYYEALHVPGAPHIVFVQQYVQGSAPPTAHSLVIDTETGLVTLCRATIGVPAAAREVARTWHFGLIDGYADPGYRHAHTTELVGKAVFWTYYEKEQVRVKHIYSAPLYYSYTMLDPATGNCWMASNPADYVKITNDVFIFSFVEERQGGTQGFFVINTKELHDVGSFFGLQPHGLECYTFGAKGEWSEPFAYDWME